MRIESINITSNHPSIKNASSNNHKNLLTDTSEFNVKKINRSNVSFQIAHALPPKIAPGVFLHFENDIESLNEHFHVLRTLRPELSAKVDTIKSFVLRFAEYAKANKIGVRFSWGDVNLDETYDFNKTRYAFTNDPGVARIIWRGEMHTAGSAESLYKLIKKAGNEDHLSEVLLNTIKQKEPWLGTNEVEFEALANNV